MSKATLPSHETGGKCHACQRIPWEYEKWPDEAPVAIEHHNSFADLEVSASHCYSCRIFRAVVYYSLKTVSLTDPPSGPCTIWLPKKSSIDLAAATRSDGLGSSNSPAVIRFYVGTVLFLPILAVDSIGPRIEFLPAAPVSLRDFLDAPMVNEIREQIHDCVNKRGVHQDCDVGWFRQDPALSPPTRLIDVGIDNQSSVRLIVTEEDLPRGHRPSYLTLSYCWGVTNSSARTTRATTPQRREGFDVGTLPKTIQEAIQVTRLLGFRYLWVDAICIIQSDTNDHYLDDWNIEAPRIGSYYLHSKCLISASAATDSSEGLYLEQKARKYLLSTCPLAFRADRQEYVSLSVPKPSPCDDWSTEPLRTRGWCLQEAVLSPRALHWSNHTLIWQCHGMTKATAYGSALDDIQGNPTSGPSQISLAQDPEHAMGEAWTDLITKYSKMRFTYESDRLIAIQGLATRLADIHGDKYFAGAFLSRLADSLLWKNSYFKADRALPNVPTWSWASRCLDIWFIPVSHSFIRFHKEDVFPVNRGPINLDTPEKRSLRIEAPLIAVDLERDYAESDIVSTVKRPVFACHARLVKDVEDRFAVNFEFDAESLMPPSFRSLMVLLLGLHALHRKRGFVDAEEFEESTIIDPDTIVSSEGIIIRRSGEYYERIGRFDYDVPKNYTQRRILHEYTEQSRTKVCLI